MSCISATDRLLCCVTDAGEEGARFSYQDAGDFNRHRHVLCNRIIVIFVVAFCPEVAQRRHQRRKLGVL